MQLPAQAAMALSNVNKELGEAPAAIDTVEVQDLRCNPQDGDHIY